MPGQKAYIGNTDFTLQPISAQFVEGQGWNTTETYTGSKSKLSAFLAQILIIGQAFGGVSAIRIREEGTTASVDVTYARSPAAGQGGTVPPDDPISRNWSLVANMVEIDVMNIPQIQNGFTRADGIHVPGLSELSQESLVQFRRDLNRMLGGLTDAFFAPKSIQAFIFNLKAREETTVLIPQYVLKKTETVTKETQILVAHTAVGYIHNANDLTLSEPSLPKAILIDPLNLVRKTFGDSPLNWLKMAPEVSQVTGGKYQIVQEYWGIVRFDPYIYKTVTPNVYANYGQKIYDW